MDPETVHEKAMWALERGLFKAQIVDEPRLSQEIFGKTFPNPLGLAAGFDKNARALDHWASLGFGHVECGTITFHPQPGNPRPRLFRLPNDRALINRMGFNNDGARQIAARVAESNSAIPVGINLGKSKIVELKQAAEDYSASYKLLHTFGDYFVVNVSSPNTPGLRELQDKDRLNEIILSLQEVNPDRPLLVKISPDLEWSAIDEIIDLACQANLAGIVATNTTIDRINLTSDPREDGGLSGQPLKKRANEILSYLFKNCPSSFHLIGVGGIFSGEDLYERISYGAHICQVYTGWVYGGPSMVPESLTRLLALMDREGVEDLTQLRGSKV